MVLLPSAAVIQDNHIIDAGCKIRCLEESVMHIVRKLLCIKNIRLLTSSFFYRVFSMHNNVVENVLLIFPIFKDTYQLYLNFHCTYVCFLGALYQKKK